MGAGSPSKLGGCGPVLIARLWVLLLLLLFVLGQEDKARRYWSKQHLTVGTKVTGQVWASEQQFTEPWPVGT